MRLARKLLLLAIAVVAASALMAPAASATEAVTIVREVTGGVQNCPNVSKVGHVVSGGCTFHTEGEFHLDFHIFGIEGAEAECHLELEGRIQANGEGYVTDFTVTQGGHGDPDCGVTTFPPCAEAETESPANDFPWHFTGEETALNTVQGHFDLCIDPTETGHCEGEYIADVVESGSPEIQTYSANDLRIGASSFCEVTIEGAVSEVSAAHPDRIHTRHLP
jgi:hypothetical protein